MILNSPQSNKFRGPFLKKNPELFIYENLSVAAAAVGITVAIAVKDNKDKNYYPYIAVIKKIAEAAHICVRPFSFLKVRREPQALFGVFTFLIL